MQQCRPPQGDDIALSQRERARGGLRKSGHLAGMTHRVRRLEVNHVGEAPRHAVQIRRVDLPDRPRLRLEHRLPRIGGDELGHQTRPCLAESGRNLRVEPATSTLLHHGECRLRPRCVEEEHCLRGDLTHPRGQRNLVGGPAVGTLAVPPLELLRHAILHLVAQSEAARDHRRRITNRGEDLITVPGTAHQHRGDLRGAPESCAATGAQRQRQHLAGVAEVRGLDCLTRHKLVTAEQACLGRGGRRTPDVAEQRAQAGVAYVALREIHRTSELARQQAGPQRGLRRLPHAQVGADGQRSQQIHQPQPVIGHRSIVPEVQEPRHSVPTGTREGNSSSTATNKGSGTQSVSTAHSSGQSLHTAAKRLPHRFTEGRRDS